jgi:hypothetical protein
MKLWTLEELETLPDIELSELIPKDVEEQFDKLPTLTRVFKVQGLNLTNKTPLQIYKTKTGFIELLNGDVLYIKDTIVNYSL